MAQQGQNAAAGEAAAFNTLLEMQKRARKKNTLEKIEKLSILY